jgi:hypothetical protein
MPVPSESPLFRQLTDLDRALPQFLGELSTIFGEEAIRDLVLNLSTQDTQWLADYLDNVRILSPQLNPCLWTRRRFPPTFSTLPIPPDA